MTEDESPSEVGIETLVAGLAAVVTLAHPAGLAVIASGAAAPGLAAGAKNIVRRWSGRSARSQETLIQWAAKTAGLTTEELRERCESDPYLEELLALVLGAASDTVSREKILAYAALIASATTPSIAKYRWESAFVSVIRDLEPIHIELLARFTLTSIELGLGIASDPAFDRVPEMLSDEQIDL